MHLYSTHKADQQTDFKTALFTGMPPEGGLYLPVDIPILPTSFIHNLADYTFKDIAFVIAQAFLYEEIPADALKSIIEETINFETPVLALDEQTYVQELYHGPSLSFKDFGARFMAQTMAWFNQDQDSPLIILAATSGDTGGAVAAGFYNVPGIQVVILYPSGKVSKIQEFQMTTPGKNITALEISGSFDDCQTLVKQAFLDADLRKVLRLSSANSINIARLLAQTFYYWEAFKQVGNPRTPVVFSIPSGNLGNVTAGIMAKKMGLPVQHFVVGTNANDILPDYLNTGLFRPKPSKQTLSSAMDVGNPSNFPRVLELSGSTWNMMQETLEAYRFSDAETRAAMRETYLKYQYVFEPHGAIGYLAWRTYQKKHPDTLGIILETAHPAKFKDTVDQILGQDISIPPSLKFLLEKNPSVHTLPADYNTFKAWLLRKGQE